MRTSGIALVLLALAACDGGGPEADAAVDASDAGGGVLPPVIPWLDDGVSPVDLGECPTGWREVADLDPIECDPYPEGGPETCSAGEAHFPGEPGCRPIGDPCPSGDFATSLPAGPTVYVRAGAAAGGDGSMASPFAALSEVSWPTLSGGTTVALARGSYAGVLPLKGGVSVVGACVAETIVTGIDAPVRSVVSVTSAGSPARVSNLTIRDASQQGAYVENGRSLHLDGVLVDSVELMGLVATGEGTSMTLEDVVVSGTRVGATGTFGVGLAAADGARIDGERVMIEESAESGAFVDDPGTVVVLSDASISEGVGLPDGTRGRGAAVRFGARFEARRALFANNRDNALIVGVDGAEALLEDVVIRDTGGISGGRIGGRGLAAQDGARVTATRVVVAGSQELGIFLSDPETHVTLDHVVVRDSVGQGDGQFGRGIALVDGPFLAASNVALLRNRDTGLIVGEGGASATLRDVLIADTLVQSSDSSYGRGVELQSGARVDAARLVLLRNHELGLFVAGESSELVLEDAVVGDTRPREADGRGGVAIIAQALARISGSRIRVDGAREHGVAAIGGEITMEDVSIHAVERAECVTGGCADFGFGYGATAVGGTLAFTRFGIAEAALCGLFVGPAESGGLPTSMDLDDGRVSSAQIGACIQSDGYDLTRLTDGVEFLDNETNLDATRLPVPEPVGTSPSL